MSVLILMPLSQDISNSVAVLERVSDEVFDFRFFSYISFPRAPEYPLGAVLIFFFAEIFAILCLMPVSMTSAISGSPV